MNLMEVQAEKEYIIKEICTNDEELNEFLFTLGCYSGEPITVISPNLQLVHSLQTRWLAGLKVFRKWQQDG